MRSNFIIESFWQRGANCACVAFIKALLLQYGLRAGTRTIKKQKGIEARLPDGSVLLLTKKEIITFNKKNEIGFRRYKQQDKKTKAENIRSVVQLLFAVLVKNMHGKGYQSRKPGTDEAITVLTKKGVQTGHFHRYLGSTRVKAQRLTNKNLWRVKKKRSVLIYNDKHIVAASGGYYDNNGHAERIGNEIPLLLGDKATHWCGVM